VRDKAQARAEGPFRVTNVDHMVVVVAGGLNYPLRAVEANQITWGRLWRHLPEAHSLNQSEQMPNFRYAYIPSGVDNQLPRLVAALSIRHLRRKRSRSIDVNGDSNSYWMMKAAQPGKR
jgi:hypothetical protein